MQTIPSLKNRDSETTKAALRQAGKELFAEHGFEGTTTERIARRAGVNKALISYHFRSKAGLYEEILESMVLPIRRSIEELRSRHLPPDDYLREFIRIFGEHQRNDPTVSGLLLRELLLGAERLSPRCLPHFLFMMQSNAEALARGAAEGIFRPVEPLPTHLSLISALIFFFATAKAREHFIASGIPFPPPTPEGYLEHIQQLFIRGLRAEKERPS